MSHRWLLALPHSRPIGIEAEFPVFSRDKTPHLWYFIHAIWRTGRHTHTHTMETSPKYEDSYEISCPINKSECHDLVLGRRVAGRRTGRCPYDYSCGIRETPVHLRLLLLILVLFVLFTSPVESCCVDASRPTSDCSFPPHSRSRVIKQLIFLNFK